jgi:hypothetical protein
MGLKTQARAVEEGLASPRGGAKRPANDTDCEDLIFAYVAYSAREPNEAKPQATTNASAASPVRPTTPEQDCGTGKLKWQRCG